MNKEVISDRQGIALIILFMTGTSTAGLFGICAKQDIWLAIILALSAALIIGIVLAYLYNRFSGKDLFDIIVICFGRFFGKIIVILLSLFAFFSGAMVLRNMSNFIYTVTLPETPQIVTIIFIAALCVWAVKEGSEVLGRWTEAFIPLYFIIIAIAVLLLIPKMVIHNLQPPLYYGIKPILKGAFLVFTYPFGEIVVFPMFFTSLKDKKSPYRIYIMGLLISGLIVLLISLADIMVLGVGNALSLYYPSYAAISQIDIGTFLQRLEILAAIVFVLGGFVKVSIYLLASCKGIIEVFGYKDYRFIVVPVGALFIGISYSSFSSIMEFWEFNTDVWSYFVLLFQILLPCIILIAAIFRKPSK